MKCYPILSKWVITSSTLLILLFISLQGCATTITCTYESDPPGAQIYGGTTPVNMSYYGVTPHKEIFTGYEPYWLQHYYQFKMEGYEDSKVIEAPELPKNTNRRVWAILKRKGISEEPRSKNDQIFTGTGWVFNDGLIVTNYHVIENQIETKVCFNTIGPESYDAEIILSDKYNDLAILKLKTQPKIAIKSIPISSSLPRVGEKVFTIGYPQTTIMGRNPKVTDGIVSSLSGVQDDPRFLQTTVAIQPGNSGGPLLNMKGEAVGITTSTLRLSFTERGVNIPQNVNYAIKSAYILALITSLQEKENAKKMRTVSKIEDLVPIIQDSIVQVIVKIKN